MNAWRYVDINRILSHYTPLIKDGERTMQRFGNLWSKICDFDNLLGAHECAQRDKKYYKEVKMVNSNPEHYIRLIQQSLLNKTYRITARDYEVSEICDKGKVRELWKLSYYPHRIIQWAVMLQIEKIFMQVFCDHTCASIKSKGGSHAYKLMRQYMKKNPEDTKYCLKIDVKKFYPNINHDILKQLLRKKFKDDDLLKLLDIIIDSFPGKIGLPIGSYLSQFLANYYLAYFDHWLKEELGVKMVIRYMDDVVIFGPTSEYLHTIHEEISQYLSQKLRLKLKGNWQIFPSNARGVDFIGYKFFHEYVLLRKTTCKKFKRKMLQILKKYEENKMISKAEFCCANSYIGWLLKCNSWRLFKKYIEPILPALILYHRVVIHRTTDPIKRKKLCRRYQKHLYSMAQRIAKEV